MLVRIHNIKTNHTWYATLEEAYYCYKCHAIWPVHPHYVVTDYNGQELKGLDLVTLMFKNRGYNRAKKEKKNV